ncbi:MAG TPA: serine/threonine protein kinase, partial [Acidobacteria bacterium]|nr:serine/threonine protein kinase [Acidobacteriota bacterium]
LDFGIAKVLEVGRVGLTQPGERLLTPDFASPEQVAGETLTTATDLYSLGALLFVLLAGRPPLAVEGLRAAEVERRICEQIPPRVSDAAGGEGVAAARRTSPARLRRRLRGDLDTIVAKALRKEPHRRYASVEQLADDVRRHLAGRPIEARRDAALYRAGRFVARHPAPVAPARPGLLAPLAGLVSA